MTELLFQSVCFLPDGAGRLEAGHRGDGDFEEGGKSRDQSGRPPRMLGESSEREMRIRPGFGWKNTEELKGSRYQL